MTNNKSNFFYVLSPNLILIAGIVWLIAGYNVARLGIISYFELKSISFMHIIGSIFIFIPFGVMFLNMSKKNARRILDITDSHSPFWAFFELKSYLIMFGMITFGIGLRASHLVPNTFIAVFYTGLGIALASAGIYLVGFYFRTKQN